MHDPLFQRLQEFLQDCGLWSPDVHLLTALSGGPDSLVLADLLRRLRDLGGPHIILAHLDHGIRGAAAQSDAAFVSATAAAWGVPLVREQRDVPVLARRWKLGLQAAARRARYDFLATNAVRLHVQAVVTAHQADDQAETVLLHLLRGAGPAGLRGMLPITPWAVWAAESQLEASVAPPLLRPLLDTSREEILEYCTRHQLAPRDDGSNRDRHYMRSRVRQDLLPALIAQNPQAVAALTRTARICADDYAYLQAQLDAVWPMLAEVGAGYVRLRGTIWFDLHPALQRYALRRSATALGAMEPSLAQIEAARALPSGSRTILIADLAIERDQQGLTIGTPPLSDWPQLPVDWLALESAVTAIGNGWDLVLQAEPPAEPDRWWVELDAGALDGTLALRRRRAGDRFRPAGGQGSRRIQDYFVDVRLPRPLRATWPILVCNEVIVWPVGWRPDARFIAGPQTRGTIWVGVRREG